MKNARAVTGPGVDVAIGVSLYLRFAGESRPASTDSNAWVEFPLFARVVVRLFCTLFRLAAFVGAKANHVFLRCQLFCRNIFAAIFRRVGGAHRRRRRRERMRAPRIAAASPQTA
jgi:hypothetical protein